MNLMYDEYGCVGKAYDVPVPEPYLKITDDEWQQIQEGTWFIDNGKLTQEPTQAYTEHLAQIEKERIAKLYMTAADVERAIYKTKGMDFDDIVALVETQAPEGLDVKALKIELKANNFYRGNSYIDQIGTVLGFTSKQLDNFFETKDPQALIN